MLVLLYLYFEIPCELFSYFLFELNFPFISAAQHKIDHRVRDRKVFYGAQGKLLHIST